MGGMVVLKFGGTSLADTQPILRVASIVARQAGSRVVVVSAHDRYIAARLPDSVAKEARGNRASVSDDSALAGASS
jgi:aspartokinase